MNAGFTTLLYIWSILSATHAKEKSQNDDDTTYTICPFQSKQAEVNLDSYGFKFGDKCYTIYKKVDTIKGNAFAEVNEFCKKKHREGSVARFHEFIDVEKKLPIVTKSEQPNEAFRILYGEVVTSKAQILAHPCKPFLNMVTKTAECEQATTNLRVQSVMYKNGLQTPSHVDMKFNIDEYRTISDPLLHGYAFHTIEEVLRPEKQLCRTFDVEYNDKEKSARALSASPFQLCTEITYNAIACEYRAYNNCMNEKRKMCNWNKKLAKCVQYKFVVKKEKEEPFGKDCHENDYGDECSPCETCDTTTWEEWSNWVGICSNLTRSRLRPPDDSTYSCKTDATFCCREEEWGETNCPHTNQTETLSTKYIVVIVTIVLIALNAIVFLAWIVQKKRKLKSKKTETTTNNESTAKFSTKSTAMSTTKPSKNIYIQLSAKKSSKAQSFKAKE